METDEKMKGRLTLTLSLTVAVGVGAVMGLALMLIYGRGFSAHDTPTSVEVFLARTARKLAVPGSAARAKNPVAFSHGVLNDARAHFADHCAICHANDGSGDTEFGRNLYPKAPDMRKEETQSLSDGELFYIISNGIRLSGMPAWGSGHPDEDLDSWKLVYFIRHLPEMSEDELREMTKLNPISRHELAEQAMESNFLEGGPPPVHDSKLH